MSKPDCLDRICEENPGTEYFASSIFGGKLLGTLACAPVVAVLLFQACTRDEALATIQANPDLVLPVSVEDFDATLEDGGAPTDSATPDIGNSQN